MHIISGALCILLMVAAGLMTGEMQTPSVTTMLEEMVADFANDIDAKFAWTFGLEVSGEGGGMWHVEVEPGKNVLLRSGAAPASVPVFFTDVETLTKVYRGELYAGTAMSKARGSDWAPMDVRLPESLSFNDELRVKLFTVAFHFFYPRQPLIIRLGEEHARVVHGGHMIPLFYYPNFRSAWGMVKKGEQINTEEDRNPYPQAVVVLSGRGKARLGDRIVDLEPNLVFYIPPNAVHIVWTEEETPLEIIWLAFGPGA